MISGSRICFSHQLRVAQAKKNKNVIVRSDTRDTYAFLDQFFARKNMKSVTSGIAMAERFKRSLHHNFSQLGIS